MQNIFTWIAGTTFLALLANIFTSRTVRAASKSLSISDPTIGEIAIVGFNFEPRNWALCNGQLLSISQNTALFSLLGTFYGGDGRVTFALPDLRGRVPIHMGNGSGLSPYNLAQSGGNEAVTLTTQQIPAHNHTATGTANNPVNSAAGNSDNPASNYIAANNEGIKHYSNSSNSQNPIPVDVTINNTGGSQPFSIMQPYLVLNYVIALQGIFPSRN